MMGTSERTILAVIDDTHGAIIDQLRSLLPSHFQFLGGTDLAASMREADALVTLVKFPPSDAIPKVRWIHLLSAGTEHVPAETLACKQWTLTHSSGPSVVPVAEWCMLMMLHFAHRMRTILDYQRRRIWYKDRVADLTGDVLRGKTVGIVGYGALGREIARLCKGFGMKVVASLGRRGRVQDSVYRTPGTGDPGGEIPDEWFTIDELPQVLPQMDYVILGLRSTPQTRHLVNRESIRQFKPSAVLVNPSRGSLVDETALIEALTDRRIAGAALDVYDKEPLPRDHPLRDAPNIVISPHCSPESRFYRDELVELIAENLRRFADGAPLLNVLPR